MNSTCNRLATYAGLVGHVTKCVTILYLTGLWKMVELAYEDEGVDWSSCVGPAHHHHIHVLPSRDQYQ